MLLITLIGVPVTRAETPEQWVALLTRVHGGFGSFLPVGILIGEDAMKRLNAKPRELDVTFYQRYAMPLRRRWRKPCGLCQRCSGHSSYRAGEIAARHLAVVIIKPRKGGEGLKYTVPMSVMPKLGQINSTIPNPLGRYDAVMAIQDLYTVEPSR